MRRSENERLYHVANLIKKNPFKRPHMPRGLKLAAARTKRRIDKRRPINVIASALTTINLYCGVSSIFNAIEGEHQKAVYFIFGAIVADMFDGLVARITKSASEFGKQLDSLCDLVSFGVAPAVLIFMVYLPEERNLVSRMGAVMAIIYVICAALRLARFNVFQSEIREYFIGLPTPAAASTVASFVLFTEYFDLTVTFWVLSLITLSLAYLMVSTVQYPKNRIKSLLLAPRHGFRLLAVIGVAIAVFDQASRHSPSIVLFPLAAAYCLFGIGDVVYRKVRSIRVKGRITGEGSASEIQAGPPPSKTGDLL